MGNTVICITIHNSNKQIKKIRWAGHLARIGKRVGEYSLGKPRGKRQLATHGCRWADNIKMLLKGIGWEGVDWIETSIELLWTQ
jgi:hypothetical protein